MFHTGTKTLTGGLRQYATANGQTFGHSAKQTTFALPAAASLYTLLPPPQSRRRLQHTHTHTHTLFSLFPFFFLFFFLSFSTPQPRNPATTRIEVLGVFPACCADVVCCWTLKRREESIAVLPPPSHAPAHKPTKKRKIKNRRSQVKSRTVGEKCMPVYWPVQNRQRKGYEILGVNRKTDQDFKQFTFFFFISRKITLDNVTEF